MTTSAQIRFRDAVICLLRGRGFDARPGPHGQITGLPVRVTVQDRSSIDPGQMLHSTEAETGNDRIQVSVARRRGRPTEQAVAVLSVDTLCSLLEAAWPEFVADRPLPPEFTPAPVVRTCGFCGAEFAPVPNNPRQSFCSRSHRERHRRALAAT